MKNKKRKKTGKKYFCDYEKELFTEKELKYQKQKHDGSDLKKFLKFFL
jgi:hypothetical protein